MQAHPEVVQGTAEFQHQITDALLPQAHPVFHDATALDIAVDGLAPSSAIVPGWVRQWLREGELPAAWLLRRQEDRHVGQRERQEAPSLPSPTPGRERGGCGLSDAPIMPTAAIGRTQKQDGERGILSLEAQYIINRDKLEVRRACVCGRRLQVPLPT